MYLEDGEDEPDGKPYAPQDIPGFHVVWGPALDLRSHKARIEQEEGRRFPSVLGRAAKSFLGFAGGIMFFCAGIFLLLSFLSNDFSGTKLMSTIMCLLAGSSCAALLWLESRKAWKWRKIPLSEVSRMKYESELWRVRAALPSWLLTNRIFLLRYCKVRSRGSGVPRRMPTRPEDWPQEQVFEVFYSCILFYKDGAWNLLELEGRNALVDEY